ncbi:GtrA family protein [Fictibacillus sp. 26RED30]|uniref:GtrA family protein n=1 Tax=Fictibacillus sp. 26RED30 TaxID=2745877 RepID=UPI0018CEF7FB|nr:GtrA family protein [Fictibacillus sp. 26RED30]MBH0161737.1 GtrA family protein [Fictibacillus sp. 26RED30]
MKKFLKFGAVGIVNTLITIGSFMFLLYLDMNYIFANITAYALGVINSYYMNSFLVFKVKTRDVNLFLKFVLVNICTLVINTAILFIFVDKFSVLPIIAQILATGFGMVINFVLNKIWTFKVVNLEDV